MIKIFYNFIFVLIILFSFAYTSQADITQKYISPRQFADIRKTIFSHLDNYTCVDNCPDNMPFYYYAEVEKAKVAINAIAEMIDLKHADSIRMSTMDNDKTIIFEVTKFDSNIIDNIISGDIPCIDAYKFLSERINTDFILRVVFNEKNTSGYRPLKTMFFSSIDIFQTNTKNTKETQHILPDYDACFDKFSHFFINKK